MEIKIILLLSPKYMGIVKTRRYNMIELKKKTWINKTLKSLYKNHSMLKKYYNILRSGALLFAMLYTKLYMNINTFLVLFLHYMYVKKSLGYLIGFDCFAHSSGGGYSSSWRWRYPACHYYWRTLSDWVLNRLGGKYQQHICNLMVQL